MELNNWDLYFEGRQDQLVWLTQQWKEAKQGRPKLITILGESGLGKTRLVQELFTHLSQDQTEDPNGYWPPYLDKGHNLACNPPSSSVNTNVNIPWLWWGMRFPIPSDRNQVVLKSPFVDQDPNLAIHAIPILRMRKRREAQWESAKTLSTLLADAASFGIYGQALSIMDMLKQRTNYKENIDRSAAQILAKQVEDVVEQTLATLCMFLKPTETDAPTVPVIMFVDDAQWIDPVTLHAIHTLMTMALDENWQLLIVCTHWHKEWNQYPGLDVNQHAALPENLKQLADILNHRSVDCALTLQLNKLNKHELEPIVTTALPGIGSTNHDYLLNEADGNPRALEEMIRLLLNKPVRYFQAGDVKGTLTSRGQKRLSKMQATDIYQLVAARFDELEAPLQDLLSTGALIGPEFLKPLVVDMLIACEESTPEFLANIGLLARKAQDLHALIKAKSKQADAFQQKLYQSVALNFLKDEDEDRYHSFIDAQGKVYHEWLLPKKYQQLDASEQIQLFELILEFACDTEDHRLSAEYLAHAFDELYVHYNHNNLQGMIASWWGRLLQQSQHWLQAFALNLHASKYGLITLLEYDTNQLQSILLLESSLTAHLHNFSHPPLHHITWHSIFGKIHSEYASYSEKNASIHFQQLYKKIVDLADEGDNSESSLRVVSNSLIEIADWIDKAECDEGFIEIDHDGSSNTRTRIAKEYDEMQGSQGTSSFLGIEFHTPDYLFTALALCSESLKISRDIADRFGDSPERLKSIAANLNIMADFTKKAHDDLAAVEVYLRESLQINRDVVDRYGETPSSLRCVSVSLGNVADLALLARDDEATAKLNYMESLQLDREIVTRFGENPERLRDISVSLEKVASLELNEYGDVSTAEAYYEESLRIRRDIVTRFGESPQRLCDISDSLELLSVNVRNPLTKQAYLEESLEINRGIIDKYGPSWRRIENALVSKALVDLQF